VWCPEEEVEISGETFVTVREDLGCTVCPEGQAIMAGELAAELQFAKDFGDAPPVREWPLRLVTAYTLLRRAEWIR